MESLPIRKASPAPRRSPTWAPRSIRTRFEGMFIDPPFLLPGSFPEARPAPDLDLELVKSQGFNLARIQVALGLDPDRLERGAVRPGLDEFRQIVGGARHHEGGPPKRGGHPLHGLLVVRDVDD